MLTMAGKVKNPKRKDEIAVGFIGGLNTFQDETLIKDSELTNAKNILLSVDGIAPREGTSNYGDDNGEAKILGAMGYYNSDGTNEFLTFANTHLKKFVGDTQTNIGSTTYDATARVNMVQARDNVYIFNGIDNLSYYDGSSITVYVDLDTPENVVVTPTGSAGSTDYSYKISAFNNVGETLASTATATTTGNATLSATNYNAVSWDIVSDAEGYNIWGRKATGFTWSYMASVTDGLAYKDTGADDPSTTIIPPEADTTAGIKCTMGIFAISRLFAAGDPAQPSRLYYGGVGTNIGNFSGSLEGGGYVDIFRNDGSEIRDIKAFQGGVVVWKDNAIYKFSFTTLVDSGETYEVPQLDEITRSFGGISYRASIAVENDIIFPAKKDGRLAFYSLGNQENYAGSVLRTNELSIKVQEKMEDVALDYLPYSCSFYFRNLYGCAIAKSGSSTNDRIWILDTRFGAWTYWEGMTPSVFSKFVNDDGVEKLFYGTESDGYMVEMFTSAKNDNDAAISVAWATKSFNQKIFHKNKNYYNPTFQFKDVSQSGALTGEIYVDGAILTGGFTVNQQISGGAGMGASMMGFTLPGDADSGAESTVGVSDDIIVESYKKTGGRSIKYLFKSATKNLDYKFLALTHAFEILPEKRLKSAQRFYVTG